MNKQVLNENVLRNLLTNPLERKIKGVEIISDCPFCGKEGHFYMNSKTNLWNCKKCGREGNLKSFLYGIGKSNMLGELPSNFSLNGGALGKLPMLGNIQENTTVEIEKKIVRFPVGFERIFEDKYLKNRNFSQEDFYFHPVGYTELKKRYKDYILIGVTEGPDVVGYVGRYTGKDEEVVRYQNSDNTNFSNLLFNINSITEKTKVVILVEGIFDAINSENVLGLKDSEEIKCVCTFGKKISEQQIKKLKKFSSVKTIILIYDGRDAITEIKRYSFKLVSEGFKVLIGFYEDGDPGSWDKKIFNKVINKLSSPEKFYYSAVKRIK